jgi:hypothetical protein
VVIASIADLDRPQEGILTVSRQALIDLRQSMKRIGVGALAVLGR